MNGDRLRSFPRQTYHQSPLLEGAKVEKNRDKEEKRQQEEMWPAEPGSIPDIVRPESPTSVMEGMRQECP